MMGNRIAGWVATVAIGVFGAGSAGATTLLFDGATHGQVIDSWNGVQIGASSNTNIAVIFNSDARNTADWDLEGPDGEGDGSWDGGNLAPDTELGGLLILQENTTGCDDDVCDDPDDEGARPAGMLSFVFSSAIMDFGFDIVDVESTVAEEGEIRFFTDAAGTDLVASVMLSDFSNPASPFYDPTVAWGNHTANDLPTISAGALNLIGDEALWRRVEIHLGGSGAVDNVYFAYTPEPATALMLGLGLLGLRAAARRRA